MDWLPSPNGDATMTMDILNFSGAIVLSGVPEVRMYPSQEMPIAAELVGNTVIMTYAVPQLVGQGYRVDTWDARLRDSFGGFLTQKYWLGEAAPVPCIPTWLNWTATKNVSVNHAADIQLVESIALLTIDSVEDFFSMPSGQQATTGGLEGTVIVVNFASTIEFDVWIEYRKTRMAIYTSIAQVLMPGEDTY